MLSGNEETKILKATSGSELSDDFGKKNGDFVKKIRNIVTKISLSIIFYVMTLVMTLCSNNSSSVSTEEDSGINSKSFLRQIPFAYPAEYLILSTVMLLRCFIGMLLKTFGFIYEDIVNLRTKPNTYKPKSQRIPYKLIKKQSHKQNHNTALFRLGLLAAINVVT